MHRTFRRRFGYCFLLPIILILLLFPLKAFSLDETLTGSLTIPSTWINTPTFTVSWSASDTGSDSKGLSKIEIEKDSQIIVFSKPYSSAGTSTDSGSFTQTVSQSGEYEYSLSIITQTDIAASYTDDVFVDLEPPILSVSAPTDYAVVSNSSISIQGSATDATSGIASLTINGQTVGGNPASFSQTVNLTPGLNTISVQAKDKAGNVAMRPYMLHTIHLRL